jgi:uncharacterized protein
MIAPAMNTRPQEVLSYRDLARQQARISRQISLEELPRVTPLAAGSSGTSLDVALSFSQEPDGLVRVVGDISGRLALVCNGCAETLEHELKMTIDCVIVASEESASERGAEADVLLADGPEISLAELVEDEVLLGLPERLCVAEPCANAPELHYPALERAGQEVPPPAERADNPFSVLADLGVGEKRTPK